MKKIVVLRRPSRSSRSRRPGPVPSVPGLLCRPRGPGGNYMVPDQPGDPVWPEPCLPEHRLGRPAGCGGLRLCWPGNPKLEGRYDYNSATRQRRHEPVRRGQGQHRGHGQSGSYDLQRRCTIRSPYIGAGAVRRSSNFGRGSGLRTKQKTRSSPIRALGCSATTSDPSCAVNLDGRYFGTTAPTLGGPGLPETNNVHRDAEPAVQVRRSDGCPLPPRLRPRRRLRRSWCSSIGTVRTCRPKALKHDQAGCWRLQDQGLCPGDRDRPYRQVGARMPTTWRCRCAVRTL